MRRCPQLRLLVEDFQSARSDPEWEAVPPRVAQRSLLRVAYQNHVGLPVAADHGELLAIHRVIEISNKLRLEVGELFPGRAVQILQPEIVSFAVPNRVNDAFAVPSENNWAVAKSRCVLGAWPFKFQ